MPIKGTILPDYLPVNKFQLVVTGLPVPMTLMSLSGLEDELDVAELPDRTNGAGGRKKQAEIEVSIPAHHKLEIFQMEVWYRECQDPVSPLHKKVAQILVNSQSNLGLGFITLVGVFISKRSLPDLELDNDGEQMVVTYTLKIDHVDTFFSV